MTGFEGKETSQEIILLDDVLEEAPVPRAVPPPRPMSSPRAGVPNHVGPYTVMRAFPSGMVDGVEIGRASCRERVSDTV